MSDIYAENMRRNESESRRLHEQFDLLSRNIGYLIHPSIAAKLPPSLTIADIGTGTGLFLSQLAQEYPDAILHGFDISPKLFPPQESLSPQVSLSVLNIKETPPPFTHNKYDLIHIRPLATGINPTEWKPIVQNLLKLLKPGGAIQWEEYNWMETQ
ncbi:hypothetical protein BHYA_0189g00120 [Botrytis hyacinthi]|uniref:Methyltransferase domain-containing protein n=1 Tax=Botrytis hyacinthi TaxID=278943 RepID=A0A4Z1GCF7_9HELO|nr:hypothetical protein BHYA_0189g00120 [Botrytis hyacinthi]